MPVAGWTATSAEVLLAVGLVIGWRLHWVALAAGLLLTTFAVTMAVALGLKPPLDYSVPSAAAAAYLLAAVVAIDGPEVAGRRGLIVVRPSVEIGVGVHQYPPGEWSRIGVHFTHRTTLRNGWGCLPIVNRQPNRGPCRVRPLDAVSCAGGDIDERPRQEFTGSFAF